MKNIYNIHQSSNSYWDNHWTDEDFILCDSEEEYQSKLAELKEKREKIEDEYKNEPTKRMNQERYDRLTLSSEGKIHAREYYYAHEWCGKTFDAFGFTWTERLERSTHIYHYLKPNSVSNENVSSAVGKPTYYGS